jgi:predicted MFS family arabinose efflux permease
VAEPRFGLLAPLRHRSFTVLWSCVAASYMAQYLIATTGQWYLLKLPGGEPYVPLVQLALTLPMALLALPSGVLADSINRRRLIIVVQSVAFGAQVAIVAMTATQTLRPLTLLALIATLAAAGVLTFTSFQSMVPDLVDRDAIPSATALLAMATNSARILAPALAGLLIATLGVGPSFAAVLPLTLILLLATVRWGHRGVRKASRERFLTAVFLGVRFVRHSSQALKLTARGLWFSVGIVGLLSLVPVLAVSLGASSGQLGLLLATQGLGAVLGAVTLPALRRFATANTLVAVAFGTAGFAILACALASHLVVAAIGLLVAGWSWTTALATMVASMQLHLPAWVRARGTATLLAALYGGQAVGSAVLGSLATYMGVRATLVAAALVLLCGVSIAVWWPLEPDSVDGSPRWAAGEGPAQ